MKKVFYAVAKTEENAVQLLEDITARYSGDPDFHAAYIDSGIHYNTAVSDRSRYKAMITTVRRGKADTILLRSINDLFMSEMHACSVLLRLKNKGISVIAGEGEQTFSTAEMTEKEIISKMNELYYDYLILNLAVPLITMEECMIRRSGGNAWVYLKSEEEAAHARYPYLRFWIAQSVVQPTRFINAVEECTDNSCFFFYRKDVDHWYFIDRNGLDFLKSIYEENMRIMMDFLEE